MNISRSSLKFLISVLVIALSGLVEGHSSAAPKKRADKDFASITAKGQKSSAEASQKVLVPKVTRAARPSTAELHKPAVTGEASPSKKRHRAIKAHKKSIPKAVVQPRTDLIHFGMLEDSQRYDPRPHTDSAAVRSPQTPELTHDHFQELDRNQDGMIDPVERAFGRIDMDRDLHSRTLH